MNDEGNNIILFIILGLIALFTVWGLYQIDEQSPYYQKHGEFQTRYKEHTRDLLEEIRDELKLLREMK